MGVALDKSIALAIIALVLGISVTLAPYIMYINSIKSATGTRAVQPSRESMSRVQPSRESMSRVQDILGYLLESKALLNVLYLSEVREQPMSISLPLTPLPPSAIIPIALPLGEYEGRRVSETNVQVVGVDELDIVKTDGRIIVTASGSNVYIVGVKDKEVLSVLNLKGDVRGVFLYNNTLVVVSQTHTDRYIVINVDRQVSLIVPKGLATTVISVISLANPVEPEVKMVLNVTGYVVGARRIDNYVYLVLNQEIDYDLIDDKTVILPLANGTPVDVDKVHKVEPIPMSYANIVIVDVDKLSYNVEAFLVSKGSRIYMTFSRLYIASDELRYQIAVRKLLEYSLDLLPSDIAKSIHEYIELGRIGKAYQTLVEYLSKVDREVRDRLVDEINARLSKLALDLTQVYVFGIDRHRLSISFRGVIEAPGLLLDQFAIEEYNNTLILATTAFGLKPRLVVVDIGYYSTWGARDDYTKIIEWTDGKHVEKLVKVPTKTSTPNYAPTTYVELSIEPGNEQDNRVYIYDVESLKLIGSLEGLAKGERVYAARVIKNILFLVTFRQVDPLFAIDIGDPSRPRVLGFLKIPGFSEYLHPLANDKLLGIGLEDGKLKISLFDVKDPTNMKEVSKIYVSAYYYSYSEALEDHKAVTVDLEFGRVYLPVDLGTLSGRFSGIAVVEIEDGSIKLSSILDHDNARRAIYVDDELFTVSPNNIKVYNYRTLEQTGEIVLSR